MFVSFTAEEIIALVKPAAVRGSTAVPIRGIAALKTAQAGELSFLGNAKYKADVAGSRASVLLVPADYAGEPQPDQLLLLVENPSLALARVCAQVERALWPKPAPGIHPTAHVAPTANVAASATIGPLCVIEDDACIGERVHVQSRVHVGRGARIGADCWLMPGVTVAADCRLGERVRLQPGVVIGADGFGYEFVSGRHEKVPQVGNVEIGDDVEIGANSTIDRARIGSTVVGEGTKIDNLVQVAHGVAIGKHCILCAQVGISGSTTLEDYVVLGGQAGVGGHITIGKGTKAGGQAGLGADVAPGSFVNGTPARPYGLERRLQVLHGRLPDLFKRVDAIEVGLKKSSSPPVVRQDAAP